MKNIDGHNSNNSDEMSFWELIEVLCKNWFTICIIVVIFLSAGIGYSFVIQDQGQVTYSINELVIYDDWEHYPSNILQTYAKNLNAFIKEETGKTFASIRIDDRITAEQKVNYSLMIIFSDSVTKTEAEQAAQKITIWHNSMMDEEVIKVKAEAEEILEILHSEYSNSEEEYYDYIERNDLSSYDNLAAASTLESAKDISYEIWKSQIIEVQNLNKSLGNAENYHISNFDIASTVFSTWKTNVAFSIVFGLVIALAFVLLKESYLSYKANKKV